MKNHFKHLLSVALLAVMLLLGATPGYAQTGTGFAPQGTQGYAIQQNGKLNQLVSFPLANPTLTRVIGNVPAGVASDFVDHNYSTLYVLGAQNTLYAVDTATAKYTVVGKAEPRTGHVWSAMAWDFRTQKMYAVSVASADSRQTASALSLIDPATGEVKPVGDIKTNGQVSAIAFNPASGALYGINSTTDQLIVIEASATGSTTNVGYIGFDANVANQSLDFDDQSGMLYLSATSAKAPREGQLHLVDLTTGSTKFVTSFGATVVRDALAIAAQ